MLLRHKKFLLFSGFKSLQIFYLLVISFLAASTAQANSRNAINKVNEKIQTSLKIISSKDYFITGISQTAEKKDCPVDSLLVDENQIALFFAQSTIKKIFKKYELSSLAVAREGSHSVIINEEQDTIYFRNPRSAQEFYEDIKVLLSLHSEKNYLLRDLAQNENKNEINNPHQDDSSSNLITKISRPLSDFFRRTLTREDQDAYNNFRIDIQKNTLITLVDSFYTTISPPLNDQDLVTSQGHEAQNSAHLQKEAIIKTDEFSRNFLPFLSHHPHLIHELGLHDLVAITKKIATDSFAEEDIAKHMEELLSLENNFLSAYLIKQSITQSDALMKIAKVERVSSEHLFELLRCESDILYLTLWRHWQQDFDSNNSTAEREQGKENSQLNTNLIILSKLRIFLALKLFQKNVTQWEKILEGARQEENFLKNQRHDIDFAYKGRYGEAGEVIGTYLKFEKQLSASGNRTSQKDYAKLVRSTLKSCQKNMYLHEVITKMSENGRCGQNLIDILQHLRTDFTVIPSKQNEIVRVDISQILSAGL